MKEGISQHDEQQACGGQNPVQFFQRGLIGCGAGYEMMLSEGQRDTPKNLLPFRKDHRVDDKCSSVIAAQFAFGAEE